MADRCICAICLFDRLTIIIMEIGTKIPRLNWKLKIASALYMGLFFVSALCLTHYLIDRELQNISNYIFQGIFFGILGGLVFPYMLERYGKGIASSIGKNIQPTLTESEQVEVEGPANLFRGIEGVGGKIFLTNKKIVFRPHKLNIQKKQVEIEYQNIEEIVKRKTAKLLNNGIRIKMNDSRKFDFVVNEREVWIEKLHERIKKPTTN